MIDDLTINKEIAEQIIVSIRGLGEIYEADEPPYFLLLLMTDHRLDVRRAALEALREILMKCEYFDLDDFAIFFNVADLDAEEEIRNRSKAILKMLQSGDEDDGVDFDGLFDELFHEEEDDFEEEE